MPGAIKNEFFKERVQIDGAAVTAYPTKVISGTYTQAEVQLISTVLTQLIATLKAQGLIA